MNGGYVMIDMGGLGSEALPVTVPGLHDRLAEAISSGKVCIIHNIALEGMDTAPVSAIVMKVGTAIRVSLGKFTVLVSINDEVTATQ